MNISPHYFTFLFLVPRTIALLKNWPLYLKNYLCRKKMPARYEFRNGLCLIDATGTLAGTIAVVFIRREYGMPENPKTIIDIGANMGSFSIYAASLSHEARIYCYEPEENNFKYLQENIKVNSYENRIFSFKSAVGSSCGKRTLSLGDSPVHSFVNNKADVTTQAVECTTLHDIMNENNLAEVDLLKINCEGAEYEILENCTSDDFKRIRSIRLEYHNLKSSKYRGYDLTNILKREGYKIERFSKYKSVSGFIWATKK